MTEALLAREADMELMSSVSDWTKGVFGAHDRHRAENYYNACVKRGRKGKFAEFTKVTPALAALLLEHNPKNFDHGNWKNRAQKNNNINKIVRSISEDRYQCNGESIIVSSDGKLLDGQNRLNAIVLSGVPVEALIAWGLPHEVATTIDGEQSPRSSGDYLSMRGVPQANLCATVARNLWQLEKFGITSQVGAGPMAPTKIEVTEYFMDNKDDILESVHSLPRPKNNPITRGKLQPILITAHYLLAKKDRPAADMFIRAVVTPEGVSTRSPIFRLRDWLVDNADGRHERLHVIFQAWNMWRTKRTGLPKLPKNARSLPLPEIV